MSEKNESQRPPPPKEKGESILEYAIRISEDKRTPEQIKSDSLKAEKSTPPEKPVTTPN